MLTWLATVYCMEAGDGRRGAGLPPTQWFVIVAPNRLKARKMAKGAYRLTTSVSDTTPVGARLRKGADDPSRVEGGWLPADPAGNVLSASRNLARD